MALLVSSFNCQIGGLTITTVGWILSMTSMGLVEWRMWYMDNSSLSPPGLACVGIWKVCVYHRPSYPSRNIVCHLYNHQNTYLPFTVSASQNLLLATSILGLVAKAFSVFALRNMYLEKPRKDVTKNLFVAAGILDITAALCLSVVVAWNYQAVMKEEGIAFPLSFRLPFQPARQEVGSAVHMAALAAFVMLLGGLCFLSHRLPPQGQVHPEVSEP